MLYTHAVVTALPRYGSDHVPLLLECETELFKGFSSLKDHGFNKKTLFRGWSFGGIHKLLKGELGKPFEYIYNR
jgi:hypothetical protein